MDKITTSHITEFNLMKKPPEYLFYKGNIELLNKPKISIVGSRRPYLYTKSLTHDISSKLSNNGYIIVSGGAMGVDAIAHKAARPENTIMVSPCGLDFYYPSVNKNLIKDIEGNGLILSSYRNDFKATKWSFVLRNEIVVALGDILIITQADRNSGTLSSAKYALDTGKEIYVLSHRVNESEGTNDLLKKGLAKPIYNIDEFLSNFTTIKKDSNYKNNDSFLDFCEQNPSYEEAIQHNSTKLFEYELMGKIKIENGHIFVC